MFIGRQYELDEMTQLYDTGAFQCVIVYGRRRVGKTALISEFVKDKEAAFYTGLETNAKENLAGFSQSIFALSKDFSEAAPVFESYKEAVEAVFAIGQTRRVVLVIDEYPFLAAAYKGISSLLQTYIDKHKETSKLFIILCGSSLSFMENQVLGYKSPLYGRRTAQFKIAPFDYATTRAYFAGNFNNCDTALLYGVTGGVPLYVSLMDKALSAEDNIKRNFLTPSGFLFEEPHNLLNQECREPAQYNAIIKAIAGGASRLSEISGKVGLETALCTTYINKLIAIGIIRREYPFREKPGKKTIYRLNDGMFRFWYRFIPEYVSLIQRGAVDVAFNHISPHIPAFMGQVFEEICAQYLWRLNLAGKTPIPFTDAGRWWGNNPAKREECEIDILADGTQDAIFAECKWTNEPIGVDVLETLIERGALFHYERQYYYLFAKTSFTDALKLRAQQIGNVTLLCFDDFEYHHAR